MDISGLLRELSGPRPSLCRKAAKPHAEALKGMTPSFSNSPRGTRRLRGMQAILENSSCVLHESTLSATAWNLVHSGPKHLTQSSSMVKDLNKKRRSWELDSDAGTEPPAPERRSRR